MSIRLGTLRAKLEAEIRAEYAPPWPLSQHFNGALSEVCVSYAIHRFAAQLEEKQRKINKLSDKLSSRLVSAKQLSSIFKNKEKKLREETSALQSRDDEPESVEEERGRVEQPSPSPGVDDSLVSTPSGGIPMSDTSVLMPGDERPPPTSAELFRRHSSPIVPSARSPALAAAVSALDMIDEGEHVFLSCAQPVQLWSFAYLVCADGGGVGGLRSQPQEKQFDWRKNPGTRLWMWGSLSKVWQTTRT